MLVHVMSGYIRLVGLGHVLPCYIRLVHVIYDMS